MSTTDLLTLLRKREGWSEAVARLRNLAESSGDDARRAADAYARVYEGRRGAMVFDVVASRQRNYSKRVIPMVARWEDAVPEPTRSEEHTSELQSRFDLVCRLLLGKKNIELQDD